MALFIALLLAYGRSGYLILGLTLFFFQVLEMRKQHAISARQGHRKVLALLVIAAVAIIVGLSPDVRERATSILDLQERGNSDRIDAWSLGASMTIGCGAVISTCTGTIGNTAAAFNDSDPQVVESGLLQQAVNFGVFATFAFYVVLFGLFRACSSSHTVLRALVLACMIESFVYQSIEVIPFIVLLSFCPVLSRTLSRPPSEADGKFRARSVPRLPSLDDTGASSVI